MSFPQGFGDFRGKTFDEVFNEDPKNTEFVYQCWDRRGCTGIFLELYDYIQKRMSVPAEFEAHAQRCRAYCRNATGEIPNYLIKYA